MRASCSRDVDRLALSKRSTSVEIKELQQSRLNLTFLAGNKDVGSVRRRYP